MHAAPPRASRVGALASVAVLVVSALVGCGTERGRGADPDPDRTGAAAARGSEKTTPRALAALVAEHLGPPDSAGPERDLSEAVGGIGASIRYGAEPGDDGDLVGIAVGSRAVPELTDCGSSVNSGLTGCETTGEGIIAWETETPEQDPGVVFVMVVKGDTTAVVYQSGPPVTADPRTLDLEVSVAEMVAIAQDPRVDLTTTRAAVAAGRALEEWDPLG